MLQNHQLHRIYAELEVVLSIQESELQEIDDRLMPVSLARQMATPLLQLMG